MPYVCVCVMRKGLHFTIYFVSKIPSYKIIEIKWRQSHSSHIEHASATPWRRHRRRKWNKMFIIMHGIIIIICMVRSMPESQWNCHRHHRNEPTAHTSTTFNCKNVWVARGKRPEKRKTTQHTHICLLLMCILYALILSAGVWCKFVNWLFYVR